MAFTWNSVSAGVTTKADDINQVKTNVDTLTSNLGVADYSWSEMAVVAGNEDEAAQITELQNALDYVDTNNVCSANNATQFGTNNADKDVTIDSTKNAQVDSDQHSTYNNSYDLGVDSTRYTQVDSDQHASYCGGWNASYNSTRYGSVYNPNNSLAK